MKTPNYKLIPFFLLLLALVIAFWIMAMKICAKWDM